MNTDTRLELRQREIIEEFEMFSDWMRNEHIIEIGKELTLFLRSIKLMTTQSRDAKAGFGFMLN